MRGVRQCVGRVAGSWLVLHLLVTTGVPVALYASIPSESVAHECTCDHPDGGICPMHRHSPNSSSSPSNACSLRPAMDPLDALVASLMGTTGVLPVLVTAVDLIETSNPLAHLEGEPLERLVPPDSPPPRA